MDERPMNIVHRRVTSYGRKISYTVYLSVSSGRQPYLEPGPDVIHSGNGVTLYHCAFVQPFSGAQQTATVSLKEAFWSLDEQGVRKATRENIMIPLQNIDYILIKSNFDRDQDEVRLSRVSLTVTTPQTTSLGKAVLVEQCSCPVSYTGPSCDQCSPGFRWTEERGQCIGQCVWWNCHGRSNDCDPRTGLCLNCRHNTEGDCCERCKTGFVGNAMSGMPEDCRPCPCPPADGGPFATASECYVEADGEISCRGCPQGYTGRQCKSCAPGYQSQPDGACVPVGQHCDSRGSLTATADPRTGLCPCKQFADGPTCSRCLQNTFYPSEANPFGCMPCFCTE